MYILIAVTLATALLFVRLKNRLNKIDASSLSSFSPLLPFLPPLLFFSFNQKLWIGSFHDLHLVSKEKSQQNLDSTRFSALSFPLSYFFFSFLLPDFELSLILLLVASLLGFSFWLHVIFSHSHRKEKKKKFLKEEET